jgi:4a-hydroxytetrahydrobiopterin dehydratase
MSFDATGSAPREDAVMSDDTATLAGRSCTPCRGGVPPLDAAEAEQLRRQTPDWVLRDGVQRIERTFKFKNFAKAFGFVARVAALAEDEGHHPDVAFGWGYVTISLQTKKIHGLHENDFIMAAKLDAIAREAEPQAPA